MYVQFANDFSLQIKHDIFTSVYCWTSFWNINSGEKLG